MQSKLFPFYGYSRDNIIQSSANSKRVINDFRNMLDAINELKNWGKEINSIKHHSNYSSNEHSPIKDHGIVKRMNNTIYKPYDLHNKN